VHGVHPHALHIGKRKGEIREEVHGPTGQRRNLYGDRGNAFCKAQDMGGLRHIDEAPKQQGSGGKKRETGSWAHLVACGASLWVGHDLRADADVGGIDEDVMDPTASTRRRGVLSNGTPTPCHYDIIIIMML
jgi:hypothetical protein